jgi:hypothetical protein
LSLDVGPDSNAFQIQCKKSLLSQLAGIGMLG